MKLHGGKLRIALLGLCMAWSAVAAEDILFVNGVAWTGDAARPQAKAVLVRDGRIVAVGKGEAVRLGRAQRLGEQQGEGTPILGFPSRCAKADRPEGALRCVNDCFSSLLKNSSARPKIVLRDAENGERKRF